MACSSPNCQRRVAPVYSPGLPGVPLLVVPVAALGQVREDPAQRGLAQPPHRLGGQLQLARVALQVALPLQLALGLPERLHVVHGLAAQGAADRGLVDVVEAGARVVLAQLGLQVGQVSEVGQGAGGVAQAERLVTGHRVSRPGRHVHLRPPGAQRVGQPGHLRGQPSVLQRLLHQRGQLVPLPVGERAEQPLRGGGPADQRVHQLLEVARVLREHLAVAVHEASKSAWVCSPRASASSIWLRSASMSLTRCMASGSGCCRTSFMPRNWLSSTSLRSRSLSCSKVSRAAWLRQL